MKTSERVRAALLEAGFERVDAYYGFINPHPDGPNADAVFERYANGRESVILELNPHLGGCQVYVQSPSGDLAALMEWIRGLGDLPPHM